ncbi:hypothetical protein SEPCBS57363_001468 [Sporothrix epigloea]|uniref:EKC/KEOPS complex subunit BUD32 n=1 Tax=Sporothrix epigloea TaxID=1892477 RepID=A0ABP0DE94_9PEZI
MDKDDFDQLHSFRICETSLDDVEETRKYAPGGYHPVDIGDVISSGKREYRVIHIFGHGGFATVWLVRSGAQKASYHALKILCAERAGYIAPELSMLEHLQKFASAGHPNVVKLQDSFQISGPNGQHQCLVFPVLGPRLARIWGHTKISFAVRRDMCRQVASAMAFLHHYGVCHGDLSPYNVVFELPDIQSITCDNDILQLLGPIKSESLLWLPAVYQKRHLAARFGILRYSERIFVFAVAFGTFDEMVRKVVDCLGPLPQGWRGRFDFNKYGDYIKGELAYTTDDDYWYEDKPCDMPLDYILSENARHISPHLLKEFVPLLRDMLVYEPEKRLSAVDVIRRLDEGRQAEVADQLADSSALPSAQPVNP